MMCRVQLASLNGGARGGSTVMVSSKQYERKVVLASATYIYIYKCIYMSIYTPKSIYVHLPYTETSSTLILVFFSRVSDMTTP